MASDSFDQDRKNYPLGRTYRRPVDDLQGKKIIWTIESPETTISVSPDASEVRDEEFTADDYGDTQIESEASDSCE